MSTQLVDIKNEIIRASGLVSALWCAQRAWKLHTPSPFLALCISSIWLFLSFILLKNW